MRETVIEELLDTISEAAGAVEDDDNEQISESNETPEEETIYEPLLRKDTSMLERPILKYCQLFKKFQIAKSSASKWQCLICGENVRFKERKAHATIMHSRGWRAKLENTDCSLIVLNKSNRAKEMFKNDQADFEALIKKLSQMYRTIDPELRVPTAFLAKDKLDALEPQLVPLRFYESRPCPRRRARELPIRHPNEAFVTANGSLLEHKEFSEGAYRCRVCGELCSHKSMHNHVATRHSRGWRSDLSKNKSNIFDFEKIPENARIPTGFYCNPGKLTSPTLHCKWQLLNHWETSILAEDIPFEKWNESEDDGGDRPAATVFDDASSGSNNYRNAFVKIPCSHPWLPLVRETERFRLCKICGYFVKLTQRRQHMMSNHKHVWPLQKFFCPHPRCASEDTVKQDEPFDITFNWKEHLRSFHASENDPREEAIAAIPSEQKLTDAYFHEIVLIANCSDSMDSLANTSSFSIVNFERFSPENSTLGLHPKRAMQVREVTMDIAKRKVTQVRCKAGPKKLRSYDVIAREIERDWIPASEG